MSAYSTGSINECGYLLSLGMEPVSVVVTTHGRRLMIFAAEAREAVRRFNDARDRAETALKKEQV